jgi:hypothetical protein
LRSIGRSMRRTGNSCLMLDARWPKERHSAAIMPHLPHHNALGSQNRYAEPGCFSWEGRCPDSPSPRQEVSVKAPLPERTPGSERWTPGQADQDSEMGLIMIPG